MGVHVTGAEKFAAHCALASAGIITANNVSVAKASLAVKVATLRGAAAASGGDLILSGAARARTSKKTRAGLVGSKGRGRLNTSYNVRQGPEGATSLVRAVGPWQLVENDTQPHDIRPGQTRSGRNRSGGAKALTIDGELYAYANQTGGSKGRHPWAKGVAEAEPIAVAIFGREQRSALARAFG